ncbi:MAG: transketolase [Spirochaetae bacterium HGW-Spirochaetae-3]|jgi:transketolase|nr:MAG: transketolase [Spirochaetae bacterium HGW-Spirochaetae-3]
MKAPSTKSISIGELELEAKELRRLILRTTHRAGIGHTGGSLSEADILVALYFRVMGGIDPSEPGKATRDRFILSKGHATPGYYSALALRGYFPVEALETFDELGTMLQAHPDMHKAPGVDMSTGSLGQGLSCGLGMAHASRRSPELGSFRTFVLMGDGELQEGQVWEAALYAGAKKTPLIVAIVDDNRVQLASTTDEAVSVAPLAEKWRAFGWTALEVDGHDMGALVAALKEARELAAYGPVVVLARTVKGKGVSFMEGRYEWHGKAPDDGQFEAAMQELQS